MKTSYHFSDILILLKFPQKNDVDEIYRRTFSTGFKGISKYSYVTDENPELSSANYYYLFLQGLFDITYGTFRSTIVEPGYGLRLDRDGQIGKLIQRALDEKIPLFVDTVDIGEGEEDRAYVINGLEVPKE